MAMSEGSEPPVYYAVPPDPPPTPGRIRNLLFAGLIGAALGGGGVALGLAAAAPAAAPALPATSPDVTSQAACLAVRGIAGLPSHDQIVAAGLQHAALPVARRWQAATTLAGTEPPHDPGYAGLAPALSTVNDGLNRADVVSPGVTAAFHRVHLICTR